MKISIYHLKYCMITLITLCAGEESYVPLSEFQRLWHQLNEMRTMQMLTAALGFGSGVLVGKGNTVARQTSSCQMLIMNQAAALAAQNTKECTTPVPCPTTTACPTTTTTTTSCPTTTTCPSCATIQTSLDSCLAEIGRYQFCTQFGNTLVCDANVGRCEFTTSCVPVDRTP